MPAGLSKWTLQTFKAVPLPLPSPAASDGWSEEEERLVRAYVEARFKAHGFLPWPRVAIDLSALD